MAYSTGEAAWVTATEATRERMIDLNCILKDLIWLGGRFESEFFYMEVRMLVGDDDDEDEDKCSGSEDGIYTGEALR